MSLVSQADERLNLRVAPESGPVRQLIRDNLLDPVEEFLSRPSKKIRGELVQAGFLLSDRPAQQDPKIYESFHLILEWIHAGSLVIDDIQDGSSVRRGRPSLHVMHGVPLALNAGNWLYFWPFEWMRQMSQQKDFAITPETEVRLYRACHQTLLRAHFGQALDVGTQIDQLPQDQIKEVSLSSLELKSGALMSLALVMGGILGGASDERLQSLDRFGHRFGMSLQMFDDLGNLRLSEGQGIQQDRMKDSMAAKRLEDLILRRPSWIWAVAASECDEENFRRFKDAVWHLPEESFLRCWLGLNEFLPKVRDRSVQFLRSAISDFENELNLGGDSQSQECLGLERIRNLGKKLETAYE